MPLYADGRTRFRHACLPDGDGRGAPCWRADSSAGGSHRADRLSARRHGHLHVYLCRAARHRANGVFLGDDLQQPRRPDGGSDRARGFDRAGLPHGDDWRLTQSFRAVTRFSAGRDARLPGRRDARRHGEKSRRMRRRHTIYTATPARRPVLIGQGQRNPLSRPDKRFGKIFFRPPDRYAGGIRKANRRPGAPVSDRLWTSAGFKPVRDRRSEAGTHRIEWPVHKLCGSNRGT